MSVRAEVPFTCYLFTMSCLLLDNVLDKEALILRWPFRHERCTGGTRWPLHIIYRDNRFFLYKDNIWPRDTDYHVIASEMSVGFWVQRYSPTQRGATLSLFSTGVMSWVGEPRSKEQGARRATLSPVYCPSSNLTTVNP